MSRTIYPEVSADGEVREGEKRPDEKACPLAVNWSVMKTQYPWDMKGRKFMQIMRNIDVMVMELSSGVDGVFLGGRDEFELRMPQKLKGVMQGGIRAGREGDPKEKRVTLEEAIKANYPNCKVIYYDEEDIGAESEYEKCVSVYWNGGKLESGEGERAWKSISGDYAIIGYGVLEDKVSDEWGKCKAGYAKLRQKFMHGADMEW